VEQKEPKQKTAKDYEIAVPKRKDVFQALKNAAKKPSRPSRPIK
jgi:hypothetical protein